MWRFERYAGVMNSIPPADLRRERWKLTARLVRALEVPMLLLSGVWSVAAIAAYFVGKDTDARLA